MNGYNSAGNRFLPRNCLFAFTDGCRVLNSEYSATIHYSRRDTRLSLLSDRSFGGADAYATAYTIAKGIEKIGKYDVVFCGMASSDGSTEWVGPQIATLLKIPVVTRVKELVEYGGEWWKVKADLENGYRLMQVKLPAVFTVTRDLNTPRTLSFSGIIKARSKEITEWGIDQLSVPEETVGQKGSPTIVSNLTAIESKREVEIITGTREEKAERLVQKLADAGVI